MMKKNLFTLLLAALFFAACSQSPKTVSGVIVDATMNSIVVACEGDTIAFSTMDAKIESENGILLADTAVVTYQGKLNKTLQGEITQAQTVVIKSAPMPAPSVVGSWMQPIPGIGGTQGVEIKEGGVAASINMATLVYKSWAQDGDSLVLSGESLGNGQTILFSNSYKIEKLTADSLVISNDGYQDSYSRALAQ